MIFHVIGRAAWQRARSVGEIETGGSAFLHLCTEPQLGGVVSRYFSDAGPIVALAVDAANLGDLVRWEPGVDPQSGQDTADRDLFPHLYGPLSLAQVDGAYDVLPDGQLGRRLP